MALISDGGDGGTVTPTISVLPPTVVQGKVITSTFTGFMPYASVQVSVIGGGGLTVYADATGSGTVSFTISSEAPGTYFMQAMDVSGEDWWASDSASVSFLVAPSTVSPPIVTPTPAPAPTPTPTGWKGEIKSVTGLENAVNTGSAVNVKVHLYAEWNTSLTNLNGNWEYSIEIKNSSGAVLVSKPWTNVRAIWDTSDSVDEYKGVSFKAPADPDYLTINLRARETIIGRAQNLLDSKTRYLTVTGGAPEPVPEPIPGPPVPGKVVLTMAVSPTNAGAVTPTPGAHTYNSGDLVPVTATTGSGYSFVNWTANGSLFDTDAMTAINVNQNITLTAHFVATGGGTVPVVGGDEPPAKFDWNAWLGKYGIYAGAGVLAVILLLMPSGKKDSSTTIIMPPSGGKK